MIYKELEKVCTHVLGTLQLYGAKKQLMGQLALSNEAKLNEMLALGHTALFFDEVDTFEESMAEIESVTADQVLAVANEILQPDHFSVLQYASR